MSSEISVARVQLADFGIELPQDKPESAPKVDLRERGVSLELWMLAFLLVGGIAFLFALGTPTATATAELVGSHSVTPIAP